VAISRKLLNKGEYVVLTTRTRVKALLLPAVVLIIVAGLAGYLSGAAQRQQRVVPSRFGPSTAKAR